MTPKTGIPGLYNGFTGRPTPSICAIIRRFAVSSSIEETDSYSRNAGQGHRPYSNRASICSFVIGGTECVLTEPCIVTSNGPLA